MYIKRNLNYRMREDIELTDDHSESIWIEIESSISSKKS